MLSKHFILVRVRVDFMPFLGILGITQETGIRPGWDLQVIRRTHTFMQWILDNPPKLMNLKVNNLHTQQPE